MRILNVVFIMVTSSYCGFFLLRCMACRMMISGRNLTRCDTERHQRKEEEMPKKVIILRQAMLRLARLPMPLRVPRPVRLRTLSHLLVLLRNPPRLAGFLLALLLRVLVVTRRRPVSQRVSLLPVTLLPHGWLTSFMRSALTRALFSMRGLCVAGLRLGSASLRLRPRGSASECTLALRRYRRR